MGSADDGDDEDSLDEDDGPTERQLDGLFDAAVTVIEQAHDVAVTAIPNDRPAQLHRAHALRQAGADLIAIADAWEVIVRRNAE